MISACVTFSADSKYKDKGGFFSDKVFCCSVVDDDYGEDWLFVGAESLEVGAESLGIGAESLEIDAELLEDAKTDSDVWLAVDGVRRLLAKSFCVLVDDVDASDGRGWGWQAATDLAPIVVCLAYCLILFRCFSVPACSLTWPSPRILIENAELQRRQNALVVSSLTFVIHGYVVLHSSLKWDRWVGIE